MGRIKQRSTTGVRVGDKDKTGAFSAAHVDREKMG